MMKHENAAKPVAMGGSGGHVPRSATPALKRGLWRNRSVGESPVCSRSPITKAFDFLPWPRSKKSTEKQQQQQGTGDAAAQANTNAATDEKKDVSLNYHRNIFRSGGGIIRDILGDKLGKDKANAGHLNVPAKQLSQHKPKRVVSRNKSLDINELINNVEHELASGETDKNGRNHFMDDTFIENIMRAKEVYRHNNISAGNVENGGAHFYLDEEADTGADCYQEAHDGFSYQHDDGQGRYNTRANAGSPINSAVGNTSPKHILFNDENTVYLIKKELPVKREMNKAVRKISPNYNEHGDKELQHYAQQQQQKNERSESVLKARFKFKKLTPDATPLPERKLASQLLSNNHSFSGNGGGGGIYATLPNQRKYQNSKSVIDNEDSVNDSTSGGKRSILQRQSTMPSTCAALLTSPELRRRQHQLYQRGEQRIQLQRRKSLTEANYEQPKFDKSSSNSSMGSGGSGGSLLTERPKSEKPRKKLSFREPVAEKARVRRRSSPLQRPLSMPDGGENYYGAVANGNEVLTVGAGGTSSAADIIANANNGNCDNWSALLHDNRYARSNNVAVDAASCGYVDNMDLTLDLESQAMRIVRTVGQAFEVCHKFNLHKNSLDHNDERSDASSELLDVEHIAERNQLSDDEITKKDQLTTGTESKPPQRPNHLELMPQSNVNMRKSPSLLTPDEDKSPTTPSSPSREIHKLKDQLEQQAMQTRQALAQLMLVREQLISETNARIEAQARTQQLLQQNRELLEHLASLGAYNEQQTTGLTSANIGMAPQSQLQMLLQATGNNNNLATINQQISNLGSINQQLTSLSHQLSGLNQQSQNLQNFQNISTNLQPTSQQQQQQTLAPSTPAASLQQPQMHLNVATSTTASNNNAVGVSSANALSSSPYPSMNQLQSISSQLQHMNAQSTQQQQDALSKDLFQVNQELLNRLQALNLGANNTNTLALNSTPLATTQQTPSPHSSFFFVNPMSCSPSNNNNSASNFNFLSTPSPLAGNLTPSPMSTLTRNSFTHSPQLTDEMGLSMDKNLNNLDEHLMKPLSGQMSASASNGNIASTSGTRENSRSSSTVDSPSSPRIRNNNEPRFNTVMLKVTDEAGNVTNQRKLSATPSFIQRSTSEKVPNRSQMMSQVQRTAWARHTTK